MAKILTDAECSVIKTLQRKFSKYAKKGWMCEGGERKGRVCNSIFNNDTDEVFWADYNGNIIDMIVTDTPLEELKAMAKIQGDIRKILED